MVTSLSPEQYSRVREALRRAEFHERGILEVLGPVQLPAVAGSDQPYFLQLTRALRPIDALIRLFLLRVPVDQAAAKRVLDPLDLEHLRLAGLIELRDGALVALVRLLPFRGKILACDYAGNREPSEKLEEVMGLTASSVALADFSVRRPGESALDLGSGGGIQSFLAAAHCQKVMGVDRSARAVRFARFNAGLNGVTNCEFTEGDSFYPVRDRRFDLIVSNPPFAVTPSLRYMYRDSGVELDGFCRNLAREAPHFLNEGGFFQMCCDCIHPSGRDWRQRLAEWFEGSGCDVWVLRTATYPADEYARMWIRDTEHEAGEASARLYAEWVSYYERNGVEAVSTILVAMRRRTAGRPSWLRIEELPDGTAGAVGSAVARGFELHDYLDGVSSEETFLAERLRVSPDVRLEQTSQPAEDGWRAASARIRMARGLAYASPIDLRLAGLVARCDGRRTLRELLAELAVATNSDLQRITPNIVSLLKELVERGFLLPPGITGPTAPGAAE